MWNILESTSPNMYTCTSLELNDLFAGDRARLSGLSPIHRCSRHEMTPRDLSYTPSFLETNEAREMANKMTSPALDRLRTQISVRLCGDNRLAVAKSLDSECKYRLAFT